MSRSGVRRVRLGGACAGREPLVGHAGHAGKKTARRLWRGVRPEYWDACGPGQRGTRADRRTWIRAGKAGRRKRGTYLAGSKESPFGLSSIVWVNQPMQKRILYYSLTGYLSSSEGGGGHKVDHM